MSRQRYPTELSDTHWEMIEQCIPAAKPGGRSRTLEMHQVVDAILYVVVGGIQWRLLPKEYPAWQSVYHYFRRWTQDRTWQRIHDRSRAQVRRKTERHKHPTAGCLDRQSVKSSACTCCTGL